MFENFHGELLVLEFGDEGLGAFKGYLPPWCFDFLMLSARKLLNKSQIPHMQILLALFSQTELTAPVLSLVIALTRQCETEAGGINTRKFPLCQLVTVIHAIQHESWVFDWITKVQCSAVSGMEKIKETPRCALCRCQTPNTKRVSSNSHRRATPLRQSPWLCAHDLKQISKDSTRLRICWTYLALAVGPKIYNHPDDVVESRICALVKQQGGKRA